MIICLNKCSWLIALATLYSIGATLSNTLAHEGIGVFEGASDVGQPKRLGSTSYDPHDQRYTISGSGYNMWHDWDEFHMAWKRLIGDFIIQARLRFVGAGADRRHVTDDQYNNLFPHISADGRWIVYLAFLSKRIAFVSDVTMN